MHTAIRGSLYRQFALLPAHAEDFRPISISCCRPAGWTPSCAIPKRAAPSPISPAKSSPRKRHHELGKVMPFGANDLSLFAAADAAIRAGSLTRRCRRATKRRWTTSGRGEHHQARGEFTLNLAADVENFTALPAGYEIARRAEKRWVVQARAPISSFPTPGSPPASARAVAPPLPFVSRNQPEETP